MTTTYGGESPVIVVINKTDQHRLLLDRATLKGLYPQIAVFAETSCLIGSGIPDLRDALIAIMVGMPHIHDLMPDSWFKVKKSLEDRPDPIIPFREYVSLCRGQGVIDEKDQVTLIDFLHALGSVLYFRHHPVLVQAGVLKRGWVTEAVYRLLNNEIVKDRGGVLKLTDLPYLLDTTDYPSEYYPYILQLMEQFDLAFHFDDDACSYLIPDLLRPEAPPLDWDESANIHFWLDYSFLPRSVLSRFITRFHGFLESNRYWRGGAVVARNGCRARVRADEGINRIVIDVFGPRYQRRDFLALIRGVLHAVQPDVKVIERVPVSNSQTVSVSYAHLLRLHAGGQSQYWVEGTDGPIDVGAVLDGIASPEHQNADAQIYIGTYIVNDTTYRVRDIHTTSLAMGPGSRSVHQEGIDSETLSRILEFMASRLEALSSLSSENLSNAKQVAEDIVKEASKGDRADQTWLEERLKNLGKMGEDILDVVTATLIDPRIGMALVVRKIANKAREEAGLDPI